MSAFYNENDPKVAAWLRELIKAGHIAPGIVDERDIRDIVPTELSAFDQCHFFAGIGVWSYALRQSGWPDDRPVWTGSCPCQPFSSAGGREGFADERHVWPHWFHLIEQCRPAVVLGEQVSSHDGLGWFDLVRADLEGAGYACGGADTCAAGFGAAHIRQRLYFAAERLDHVPSARRDRTIQGSEGAAWDQERMRLSGEGGRTGRLADADGSRYPAPFQQSGEAGGEGTQGAGVAADGSGAPSRLGQSDGINSRRDAGGRSAEEARDVSRPERHVPQPSSRARGMGHTDRQGREPGRLPIRPGRQDQTPALESRDSAVDRARPSDGLRFDADWLFCRDGKWRPVEPQHVKVVDGPPQGMGCVCDPGSSGAEDEEVSHAQLQTVQSRAEAEEVLKRCAGSTVHASPAEILRPGLHGSMARRPIENQDGSGGLSAVSQDSRNRVRDMRIKEESPRSPHGRGPTEQQAVKLEDVVRLLSPSRSLAAVHGDWRTTEELRALREAIRAQRPLRDSSVAEEEIWASLSEEEKDRLRLGFDAARWQLVAPFPLEKGAECRVMRLRGYGNALDAGQATAFCIAAQDALAVAS